MASSEAQNLCRNFCGALIGLWSGKMWPKKLEGAISGPDRAPNFQAQIWARSGRAFHYWSGARHIALLGPHFSRSGPHQNFCTGISAIHEKNFLQFRRFVKCPRLFYIFPNSSEISPKIRSIFLESMKYFHFL